MLADGVSDFTLFDFVAAPIILFGLPDRGVQGETRMLPS